MKDKILILYIEGTADDTNGDLRQGFSTLLAQKLQSKMPRIKMTDGKSQAINTFKHPLPNHNPLLIIDLDKPEEHKNGLLKKEKLEIEKDKIFFMVQEMEAWFLSQPSILDEFYNYPISKKIKRNPKEIDNPSDVLADLTKGTKKGKYHKVNHGVELLKQLNLDTLMKNFSDVENLVKTLDK